MSHATLTDDDDRIRVDTRWNEKEQIKQIAGARWNAAEKYWTVPLTWTACMQLRGVFGETLTVSDNLTTWAWRQLDEVKLRLHLRELTVPDPELISRAGGMLPNLYPFQAVGADFLWVAQRAILADEMGTGKTVQALAAIDKDAYPVIVICPNSVKTSWRNHVNDWLPDHVTPYVIEGGAAQRGKILKVAAADPYAVVIVNYEALRGLSRLSGYGSTRLRRCRECDPRHGEEGITATRCQVHPKELNRIPFRTVIIDEAHRIKSPSSQQTRAVWTVAHGDVVRYCWPLTGTPLANHPGDLWSILHAMAPTEFPTKTHFVDRYCLQSWNAFGGLDIVGINPATRAEFFSVLDPRFRRMSKDVVLRQLPPKVRSTRWVEMGPKQRRTYNQLETALTAEVDHGHIVPKDNLVAHLRLMQLSSSTVDITEDGAIRMVEPSPKIDALEDILDEMEGRPVAVCAYHRQLIDLAAARLKKRGEKFGLITGGVSEYERDLALRQFQAGEIRVLLFTISAGGVGLTMTAADTIVFLQRSWSMIDNKQAEDRVHRIGSERHESIHVIDIVAKDSVEESQIESLMEKFMRLQEIVRDRLSVSDPAAQGVLDAEEDRIMNSRL